MLSLIFHSIYTLLGNATRFQSFFSRNLAEHNKIYCNSNRATIASFSLLQGLPAQFRPGSSGELATIWYSPPFERTDRLHILS